MFFVCEQRWVTCPWAQNRAGRQKENVCITKTKADFGFDFDPVMTVVSFRGVKAPSIKEGTGWPSVSLAAVLRCDGGLTRPRGRVLFTGRRVELLPTGSLRLLSPGREDEGVYTCTASNRHGTTSAATRLHISGRVEQTPGSPRRRKPYFFDAFIQSDLHKYICQKKEKQQHIAVGTVRMFIEPSTKRTNYH